MYMYINKDIDVHKWTSMCILYPSLQVNAVAFSPDFQFVVTGCDDQRVRVFNTKSGEMVCKLKGHTGTCR